MAGFKKSIQKLLKFVKKSEDKDKKKVGETSKKKEIKKFKELTFDAGSGSDESHDSGADLNDDQIIRPDSPSRPAQVRSLIDERDSPHLRRFIQSARPADGRKPGLTPPRPARQTNSDQPEKIEESKEVMSASCDVLLPETNTDTSSASSSCKPTAIVKPCHKQEPAEVGAVIEKNIRESEPEEDKRIVNNNERDDIDKNVPKGVLTDSTSAKNELDTEHAALNDAVIDQNNAEDNNDNVGQQGDASAGVIAQAEKVVEVTQESLDELSAKIMRCDEDIRSHRVEIKRVDTNNEQMLIVVDEFERTIQQIVKERERESVYLEIQREAAGRERDEVVADLQNVERAFNDLNSKFLRTKDVVASFAATEEGLKQNVEVLSSRLAAEEEKYNNKKSEAESQLAEANERLSVKRSSGAREVARLTALLRKAEMNVSSTEEKIKQKASENADLTTMCDELLVKCDAVAAGQS